MSSRSKWLKPGGIVEGTGFRPPENSPWANTPIGRHIARLKAEPEIKRDMKRKFSFRESIRRKIRRRNGLPVDDGPLVRQKLSLGTADR